MKLEPAIWKLSLKSATPGLMSAVYMTRVCGNGSVLWTGCGFLSACFDPVTSGEE